jgi:hypothetical protein
MKKRKKIMPLHSRPHRRPGNHHASRRILGTASRALRGLGPLASVCTPASRRPARTWGASFSWILVVGGSLPGSQGGPSGGTPALPSRDGPDNRDDTHRRGRKSVPRAELTR